MLAGEPYVADDPRIADAQAAAHRLMETLDATPAGDRGARHGLLCRLPGSFGDGAELRPPLVLRLRRPPHHRRPDTLPRVVGPRYRRNHTAVIRSQLVDRPGVPVTGPGDRSEEGTQGR